MKLSGTLRMRNNLGTEVEVGFDGGENRTSFEKARVAVLRELAPAGLHIARPVGGYEFPLTNLGHFDFALIGAQVGKISKGGGDDHGLWFEGSFYKVRVMEAVNDRKKDISLPRCVKFSRGARASDELRDVEVAGEFSYVSLVKFTERGGTYVIPNWSVDGQRSNGLDAIPDLKDMLADLRSSDTRVPAQQASAAETPAHDPLGRADANQLSAIKHLLDALHAGGQITSAQMTEANLNTLSAECSESLGVPVGQLSEVSVESMRAVYKALKEKLPVNA